jgi:3-oxoadipate CoA-transferase beta subunit
MKPISSSTMAWRAAQDIPDGAYVNLGIGLPERVADFLPAGREVIFHSENGLLGMGPQPAAGDEDSELINAGKKPVTLVAGGAFFHHADSFAMIRGRHIDICIMGAFEVSAGGDLANWTTATPGVPPAVGGAMDLAQGARQVFVLMSHTTKDGRPKLLDRCTLPLTGPGVVRRIYTDLAVIDVTPEGFVAREIVAGGTRDSLAALTGAPLKVADDCRVLAAPA